MTDLDSAVAAVEEIIEQGEGARGECQTAHYGRFLEIHDEHAAMCAADPDFRPARPVLPAFSRQHFDVAEPQPLITDPTTRGVADMFNMGYEVLLQMLTRYFTHTDETPEQLATLVSTAFGLMAGVLRPLGDSLTALPVGPEHPGRTAGPTVSRRKRAAPAARRVVAPSWTELKARSSAIPPRRGAYSWLRMTW